MVAIFKCSNSKVEPCNNIYIIYICIYIYIIYIYRYILFSPHPPGNPRAQQQPWMPRGDADYTWHTWRCSTFCGFSTRHMLHELSQRGFFHVFSKQFLLLGLFWKLKRCFFFEPPPPRKKKTKILKTKSGGLISLSMFCLYDPF